MVLLLRPSVRDPGCRGLDSEIARPGPPTTREVEAVVPAIDLDQPKPFRPHSAGPKFVVSIRGVEL